MKVTYIKPNIKNIIDPEKLQRELSDALDHTANIVRDDFGKTVQTWKQQPTFTKQGPKKVRDGFEASVFTDNMIYFFIDVGTRAHVIVPKMKGGRLRFRTQYKAKTRVGIISSQAGGARGPFVMARRVLHPGFPARQFAKTIAKRRQQNLVNLVRLAFNRSFRFGGSR